MCIQSFVWSEENVEGFFFQKVVEEAGKKINFHAENVSLSTSIWLIFI